MNFFTEITSCITKAGTHVVASWSSSMPLRRCYLLWSESFFHRHMMEPSFLRMHLYSNDLGKSIKARPVCFCNFTQCVYKILKAIKNWKHLFPDLSHMWPPVLLESIYCACTVLKNGNSTTCEFYQATKYFYQATKYFVNQSNQIIKYKPYF